MSSAPAQAGSRASNLRPFLDSGFFALRTPLLPLQAYIDWSTDLEAPASSREKDRLGRDRKALEEAISRDRATLRQRLHDLLEDPVIREAVFVASPDLTEAIEIWREKPDTQKGRRAEESLVRYLTRMACRATPFGLFAGCSVGTIGRRTRLELDERSTYRRHARLDMDYLTSLTEAIAKDTQVQSEVELRANPTLYKLGSRLRYAETRPGERGRSHHLVGVTATPVLEHVLCDPDARHRVADLVPELERMAGVSAADAQAFIHTLVENQALQSDVVPPITGPEPTAALVKLLEEVESTQDMAAALGAAHQQLETMEEEDLGLDPGRYSAVADALSSLPVETKLSRLFQVDMRKPMRHAELGPEVLQTALQGVEILYYMAPGGGQDEIFDRFVNEFSKRYETQEIPLVEALDEENGIGFSKSAAPGAEPSPLLEEVVFATPAPDRTTWGVRERAMLQMLLDAQERGDQEVELNPNMLAAIAARPRKPLPAAFSTMFTLAAESEEALAEGKFELLINSASGPSGANLLGRFCHADDELTEGVKQHIASEEALDEDAIYAEVVHLPEGRVGNILLRPQLRQHRISLLGAGSGGNEEEIPITDLMVSVRGGQVVLRSKRLDKRVYPRLTTAHAYFTDTNLGIYKFLCSLQWQGTSGGLTWNWAPFQTAKFHPRIRMGQLILERAQWLIEGAELKPALEAEGAQRFLELQKLRKARRLPRRFALADLDNELLVDLDNILSIDSFLAVVKKRPYFVIKEIFPDPDRLTVRGPEGSFASEIIVPFVRNREMVGAAPSFLASAPPSEATRLYAPGSEWLYSKLYTGTSTADWLLRDVVSPLVQELKGEGIIDRWHFIRYADPDFHIRVRFHGEPEALTSQAFPRLSAALEPHFQSRELWKMQLDCYQPEVERYGGPPGIGLAEQMFESDSDMVVGVLQRVWGEALNQARGLLTIKGIDVLLDDFGYDLEGRHRLMKDVSDGFAREFGFSDTPLRHQISKKFRAQRRELEQLLHPKKSLEHPLSPMFEVFTTRSQHWASAIAEMRKREDQLVFPLDSVVSSIIHMMANRLLRSANRAQELLIYSYLFRIYDSRMARNRKAKGKVLV